MLFYLAGADPYEHDRFGKLKLTKAGLAERDELVFTSCRRHEVSVTLVMAGGYAHAIDDVVAINAATIGKLFELQEHG